MLRLAPLRGWDRVAVLAQARALTRAKRTPPQETELHGQAFGRRAQVQIRMVVR